VDKASFWKDAGERALKTFAQTVVALLSAGGFGLVDAPWSTALNIAALAAVLSVLTSIASAGVGQQGTASLVAQPAATEAVGAR
jgi:hypothetical protein